MCWVWPKANLKLAGKGNKVTLDRWCCFSLNALPVEVQLNALNVAVKRGSRRGVTLPELLMVVVVLVVLLGMGGSAMKGVLASSRRVAAQGQVVGWFERARTVAVVYGRPSYLVLGDPVAQQEYASATIYLEAEDPAEAPVPMSPWQQMPPGYSVVFKTPVQSGLSFSDLVLPDGTTVPGGEGRCVKFSPTGEITAPVVVGNLCYALKGAERIWAEVSVSRLTGKVKVVPGT